MKKKEFDITNLFHIFLFAILFLLGFSYITTSNPDSDMWWMMTTGKWIIEHKALPTENVFVIHDGYHMIVQQWIPAILNYTLYHHFGFSFYFGNISDYFPNHYPVKKSLLQSAYYFYCGF